MTDTDIQLAQQSYERCSADPGFFKLFYDGLLESHPVIQPKFAKTEFDKQHRLLKHAIGLLLIYGKHPNPALLERLAIRHDRYNVDVDPALYPFFVNSLIAAVKQYDSEFSTEVEAAWRAAVAPGINFLKSMY